MTKKDKTQPKYVFWFSTDDPDVGLIAIATTKYWDKHHALDDRGGSHKLDEILEPFGVKEISESLYGHYDEDADAVEAALTYLDRDPRFRRIPVPTWKVI